MTRAPVLTNELEVSVAMDAHLHCSPASATKRRMWDSHRVIPNLFSVVEQKQGEEGDQNSQRGAENSEPEWDV
jgi:hypothetical protein